MTKALMFGATALLAVAHTSGAQASLTVQHASVSMPGTACKPANGAATNVQYGTELWAPSGGTVICPLTLRTKTGQEQNVGNPTVRIGSNNPVSCTAYGVNLWGEVLFTQTQTASQAGWRKTVNFTGPATNAPAGSPYDLSYFVMCNLPPASAVYSVTWYEYQAD
ncbi:MAG: hypothetical protein SF187_30200 [Deltaproteobacteria bacterium]|nr:hypothetical protein [Deltaproteobacteria bacterium]